jgi:ribonucleoside-triphosphate reductase
MYRRFKGPVEIFSAVSSPVRLRILRLLSARGPLTYSEIMEQLNLKPSRDAGKFVYHLKNLVAADLISLDKESRRYRITGLGNMVNNFFQELAEYSLKKSGKMLVRTSKYSIEEFDRSRITSSLIEEAGVPPEVADKISAEAEERLLKLPIRYLTAPLIRELVNAILIEQGLEDYRHKLTRLGMPVHDVSRTIKQASERNLTALQVRKAAGSQVLTEYALLNILPREVADAHLSGLIHLSNLEDWVLRPHSIHHDLRGFLSGVFKPLSPLAPEVSPPESFGRALTLTVSLVEAFSQEVSGGQTLEYFNVFLAPLIRGLPSDRILSLLEVFLQALGFALDDSPLTLGLELAVPEHLKDIPVAGSRGVYGDFEEEAVRLLSLLLDCFSTLSEGKPPLNLQPALRLRPEKLSVKAEQALEKAHVLASKRGFPFFANLSAGEASYRDGGCLFSDWSGDWEVDLVRCGCLGMATLNLPRAAYEARGSKDRLMELLASNLRLTVEAFNVKAEGLKRRLGEGVLPNLSQARNGEPYFRLESSACTICLLGLNEAVKAHLGYWLEEELMPQHFAMEILEFLKGSAEEEGKRLGVRVNLSHLAEDEASQRLALMDVERYGWSRVVVQGGRESPYYSYVPLVSPGSDLKAKLEVEGRLQPSFNGGHITLIPVGGRPGKALQRQTRSLSDEFKLRFFAYDQPLTYCQACGKTFQGFKAKCPRCGSIRIEAYARQSTSYLPVKWWVHQGKLKALKGA